MKITTGGSEKFRWSVKKRKKKKKKMLWKVIDTIKGIISDDTICDIRLKKGFD